MKWYKCSENSLAVSLKSVHKTPHNLALVLLDMYSREMRTYIHTKKLYTNVHSSFVHNSQKLKVVQMSFNRLMVKQTVVCPHHVILLNNKKEKLLIHTTRMNLQGIFPSEKSHSQKATSFMIPFIYHFILMKKI